jgi:hypothetical protein
MDFTTSWPKQDGYYWFVDTEYPAPQIGFIQRDILWYGDVTYRQTDCSADRKRGIRIGDQIRPPHCSQVRITE